MLKYKGRGAFLPGVPDRDLTDEEVKQHGGEAELLKSGLYEKPFGKALRQAQDTTQDVPKHQGQDRPNQAKNEVKDA